MEEACGVDSADRGNVGGTGGMIRKRIAKDEKERKVGWEWQ